MRDPVKVRFRTQTKHSYTTGNYQWVFTVFNLQFKHTHTHCTTFHSKLDVHCKTLTVTTYSYNTMIDGIHYLCYSRQAVPFVLTSANLLSFYL